jgi:hypothetical protein
MAPQSISEQQDVQKASPHFAHRNDPQNVTTNLQARLNEGIKSLGESLPKPSELPKLHKGGIVKKTGPVILKKGETVTPAPEDAQQALAAKSAQSSAPQQASPAAAPQQNAPEQDNNSSNVSDESSVAGEGVNLHRAFSKLQESVTQLLDGLGISRSATVPHISGETTESHINNLSAALHPVGGVTKNMITVGHTIHGSGESVAHPSEKLRQVLIPAKFEPAIKAVAACRSFVSKVESLIGETPETQVAKSQIALIGRQDGKGMTAFDLSAALLSVPSPLIKLLAKKHSLHKHGRVQVHLTGADSRN